MKEAAYTSLIWVVISLAFGGLILIWQGDDKAFLTHCGRAFLIDVTLQCIPNYNLQCQSFMDKDHDSTVLFAPPATPDGPPPAGSVGAYLNQSGRVEVIWFALLFSRSVKSPLASVLME